MHRRPGASVTPRCNKSATRRDRAAGIATKEAVR
jgi:hypothetical protein